MASHRSFFPCRDWAVARHHRMLPSTSVVHWNGWKSGSSRSVSGKGDEPMQSIIRLPSGAGSAIRRAQIWEPASSLEQTFGSEQDIESQRYGGWEISRAMAFLPRSVGLPNTGAP